jgi:SAM-dependent MidA family methyltransferase
LTRLAELIAEEIRRKGPIRFDRFMELALYHPELGYYRRRDRDPFGRSGDFFTASQLQPVFGRVIARAVQDLQQQLGAPPGFTLVELGPGRGEMASALSAFRYVPVEAGEELPQHITGIVFSNEFFDALPVRLLDRDAQGWKERVVTFTAKEFAFASAPYDSAVASEQESTELHEASAGWIRRIARNLERGYVLTIDYGFTAREALRFPQGTLMSYRSHQASGEVLQDPGSRDITSHVPFDVLRSEGEGAGLRTEAFETLSQFLLRLGERDQFAEWMEGCGHGMLKTLLYGMGETFRVLLQSKNAGTK